MMDHIRAEPGISWSELAEVFDVTASTISWHARKLAGADLLSMERRGRRRLFFAQGGGRAARQQAHYRDALRKDGAKETLAIVRALPGMAATVLAQRLGVGMHVARDLLLRLAKADLVRANRGGRSTHYYAT